MSNTFQTKQQISNRLNHVNRGYSVLLVSNAFSTVPKMKSQEGVPFPTMTYNLRLEA